MCNILHTNFPNLHVFSRIFLRVFFYTCDSLVFFSCNLNAKWRIYKHEMLQCPWPVPYKVVCIACLSRSWFVFSHGVNKPTTGQTSSTNASSKIGTFPCFFPPGTVFLHLEILLKSNFLKQFKKKPILPIYLGVAQSTN